LEEGGRSWRGGRPAAFTRNVREKGYPSGTEGEPGGAKTSSSQPHDPLSSRKGKGRTKRLIAREIKRKGNAKNLGWKALRVRRGGKWTPGLMYKKGKVRERK